MAATSHQLCNIYIKLSGQPGGVHNNDAFRYSTSIFYSYIQPVYDNILSLIIAQLSAIELFS